MVNEFWSLLQIVTENYIFMSNLRYINNIYFTVLGGLRLFKRLRLLILGLLYKAMFIWEATFIRDLRVNDIHLDCCLKRAKSPLQKPVSNSKLACYKISFLRWIYPLKFILFTFDLIFQLVLFFQLLLEKMKTIQLLFFSWDMYLFPSLTYFTIVKTRQKLLK